MRRGGRAEPCPRGAPVEPRMTKIKQVRRRTSCEVRGQFPDSSKPPGRTRNEYVVSFFPTGGLPRSPGAEAQTLAWGFDVAGEGPPEPRGPPARREAAG